MSKMHKVVVVGRTNVGKSSLFNRIAPNIQSLTFDQEGVTRDYLTDVFDWNGETFEIVDTGGIDLFKNSDLITAKVTEKVKKALDGATVILMVVDLKIGITSQDSTIARYLHSLKKEVIVLANKADNIIHDDQIFEFAQLGFEKMFPVSAVHGRGVADMLDEVVRKIKKTKLPAAALDQKSEFKVALLGRPNAGKSSLVNLLANEDFSIVSDRAGTTREAIRKKIAFNKQIVELIDTAGVRKKAGISTKLESMMVTNALQISKRAHIVLMMLDVEEPHLSSQELKLASYAFEKGSAVIALFNKTDLLDNEKKTYLEYSLEKYEYFLRKLETIHISCKTGKNIGKILPTVEKVWERFNMKFSERRLTDIFMDAVIKTPLYKNGVRLTFYGAKQLGYGPLRIELLVKNKPLYEPNHIAFYENVLRKKEDLVSVPIFIYLKEKK